MNTALQEVTSIVQGFTGLPASLWRDDDLAPFSDLSKPCLLIQANPGSADKDIGSQEIDVTFFSKGNGSAHDQINTLNDAYALERHILQKRNWPGQVHDMQVVGSVGSIMKDGQGRWAVPLSIQVRLSTGAPE